MSNKMTKCKACDADIAKNAKACPVCGAKNKKPIYLRWWFWVLIVVFVVSIGSSGDSESEQPTKVGEVEASPAPTEKVQTEFGVGEIVELNDILVTLVSVTEDNGSGLFTPEEGNVYVVCEFNIENNSDKDISVSSLLCFEAYVDDYTTDMSLYATMNADGDQLDGTVAAGKKMRGIIGYEVPADWSEMEVRFTPDFWSGRDIIFVAGK